MDAPKIGLKWKYFCIYQVEGFSLLGHILSAKILTGPNMSNKKCCSQLDMFQFNLEYNYAVQL